MIYEKTWAGMFKSQSPIVVDIIICHVKCHAPLEPILQALDVVLLARQGIVHTLDGQADLNPALERDADNL